MVSFSQLSKVAIGVVVLVLLANSLRPASTVAQRVASGTSPFVSDPVPAKVSPEVRHLPLATPHKPGDPVREANPRPSPSSDAQRPNEEQRVRDPLLDNQSQNNLTNTPAPRLNFDGIPHTGFNPPDTVGDVGPNHYVQMVNSQVAVFSKNGTLMFGPTAINSLWTGQQDNLCAPNAERGYTDPIVLYDHLADRWLLSQFTGRPDFSAPWSVCIAISRTPDPLGAYWLYTFPVNIVPDYLKFAVWPDAYYMTTSEFIDPDGNVNSNQVGIYAFDRTEMLTGQPAMFQDDHVDGQNFMLPGDLDGPPPPPGSPNYIYTFMDGEFWPAGGVGGVGRVDRLDIWEAYVDFTPPGNLTFTHTQSIPTAAFDFMVCGYRNRDCIPQPPPGENLAALADRAMWRLQYRNFGSYETLVGNFTVDVNGDDQAGIRWFELRRTDGGDWTLYQEGTHAPDANHRWLGSIAMDRSGNIALGYSISGPTLNPSIRYATRNASDPLGTLGTEETLIAGGGVQLQSDNPHARHRWGDYSSMNVDPVDGCTFWYTNEYYPTTAAGDWHTRIGTFRVPECGQVYLPMLATSGVPDLVASLSISPDQSKFVPRQPVQLTVTVTNQGTATAAPFWVDLFINPEVPPTAANIIWSDVCMLDPCYGIAWGVVDGLGAGQSITLTSDAGSYDEGYTIWPGYFVNGTSDLYVYADSWNPGNPLGAVAEQSETNNSDYIQVQVTGTNPTLANLKSVTQLPRRPARPTK